MLLGELTERIVAQAVAYGVLAVLPSPVRVAELEQAVRRAATGGIHPNAWMIAQLKQRRTRAVDRAPVRLTARETEVLRWLYQYAHLGYGAIAQLKGRSRRTIESHRDALFAKLRVHSRPDLLKRAMALRLL
ncbi:MAG: LuxR C-terminal-related transcriptional regulator [Flavobacteriales bacterium]